MFYFSILKLLYLKNINKKKPLSVHKSEEMCILRGCFRLPFPMAIRLW